VAALPLKIELTSAIFDFRAEISYKLLEGAGPKKHLSALRLDGFRKEADLECNSKLSYGVINIRQRLGAERPPVLRFRGLYRADIWSHLPYKADV